jgi:hypothetical protein
MKLKMGEFMTKTVFIFTILLFLTPTVLAQQSHPYPEELRIKDAKLTIEASQSAIQNLWAIKNHITNSKSLEDIVDDPLFYIGYHSNLTMIEGYVLKLNFELAKTQYLLLKCTNGSNSGSNGR